MSNHNTHSVLLYERSQLGEDADPVGILRGVNYPHGIRFGADDAYLVVADAGAPYVHVFRPSDDGWDGVSYPAATITVMDDDTFLRGRYNQHGGRAEGDRPRPALEGCSSRRRSASRSRSSTSSAALEGELGRAEDALVRYEIDLLAKAESLKATAAAEAAQLRAEIASIRATANALQAGIELVQAELERVNAEYERLHAAATESNAQLAAANDHLTQVHQSKSWRLTAPMRRAFELARRLERVR